MRTGAGMSPRRSNPPDPDCLYDFGEVFGSEGAFNTHCSSSCPPLRRIVSRIDRRSPGPDPHQGPGATGRAGDPSPREPRLSRLRPFPPAPLHSRRSESSGETKQHPHLRPGARLSEKDALRAGHLWERTSRRSQVPPSSSRNPETTGTQRIPIPAGSGHQPGPPSS
jgi:hypothetical protein